MLCHVCQIECYWKNANLVADAWNLLFGAAKDEWATEADIDELHNAATAAKHNIDNLSKVSLAERAQQLCSEASTMSYD